MKLTELRLSSLFYPINRSNEVHLLIETPFKVCSIGFKVEAIPYDKVPAQVEKWAEFNPNDLSPIPITEKWLFKFKFIKEKIDNDLSFFTKGGLVFILSKKDKDLQLRCKEYDFPKLKFMHELQNFYFAITGEDLLTVGGRS